jgi:hypothetical protein
MKAKFVVATIVPALAFAITPLAAQGTTAQVDNARTSANLHETVLTPSNVNARQFGKIFSLRVDGDVYAQPLYVPHLAIPGKGVHNVLFVATEHDSVYAFDADGSSHDPLWQVNFLKQGSGLSTVPAQDVNCPFIEPEIGITPTPVIDMQAGTLFVLARTKAEGGLLSSARYEQKLHALAITTGVEKKGSPIEIKAEGFDALRELPRAALLLANDQVFLTWGSSCDVKPYHGWVMAYDRQTLSQTAVLNTSPRGGESGIWQSDNGPAADEQGNVYLATGNGTFNVSAASHDYGDTVLKLGLESGKLIVRDSFTPSNQDALNSRDADVGSGGPLLFLGYLLVIGGKNGVLYVLDRDRMGGYQTGGNSHAVQTLHFGEGIYSAPAYWNGHMYLLASNDFLADLVLKKGHFADQLAAVASRKGGQAGATPTVSANGAANGIVWLIETKAWNDFGGRPAVLHAYEASNVANELFNSEQNSSRDRAGPALRFTIPTVVNGRVYVGAKGEVDVYGPR